MNIPPAPAGRSSAFNFSFLSSLDDLPPGVVAVPLDPGRDPAEALAGACRARAPFTASLWGLTPIASGGFSGTRLGEVEAPSDAVPVRLIPGALAPDLGGPPTHLLWLGFATLILDPA